MGPTSRASDSFAQGRPRGGNVAGLGLGAREACQSEGSVEDALLDEVGGCLGRCHVADFALRVEDPSEAVIENQVIAPFRLLGDCERLAESGSRLSLVAGPGLDKGDLSERAHGLVADVVGEVATIHLMQAAGKRRAPAMSPSRARAAAISHSDNARGYG